uniref:Lebercilin-like protein n=1 Tax=Diabrotica virgifera virgifera TaxID=50390 RepID=A0A6P7GIH3_DIAVI
MELNEVRKELHQTTVPLLEQKLQKIFKDDLNTLKKDTENNVNKLLQQKTNDIKNLTMELNEVRKELHQTTVPLLEQKLQKIFKDDLNTLKKDTENNVNKLLQQKTNDIKNLTMELNEVRKELHQTTVPLLEQKLQKIFKDDLNTLKKDTENNVNKLLQQKTNDIKNLTMELNEVRKELHQTTVPLLEQKLQKIFKDDLNTLKKDTDNNIKSAAETIAHHAIYDIKMEKKIKEKNAALRDVVDHLHSMNIDTRVASCYR